MLSEKEIRKGLDRINREQEFFKDYNLRAGERTSASISMADHEINITYVPDLYEKIADKGTDKYLARKKIQKESVPAVVPETIYKHEIGHRRGRNLKGCPMTFDKYSEKIFNPIYEKTKWGKNKIHGFANGLTDFINNTNISSLNDADGITSLNGFFLYLKEQGKIAEQENEGKFSKSFEVYARLHLCLDGRKPEKELLKKYFSFDKEVNTAIKNFFEKTGISEMKKDGEKDRKKIKDYLINEENWPEITRIYTEEFSKFEEGKPQCFSYFGAGGKCGGNGNEKTNGKNSGGQNGTEGDNGQEKTGNGDEEKFDPSDGFGYELNDKGNIKKLIRGSKAGKEPGWLTNFEYLINYYEILASDKTFELVSPKTETKMYPLIDLGQRKFDYFEDSAKDIIGIYFDEEEKCLELRAGKYKYKIEAKSEKNISNKPDFVLGMFDTSGSMQDAMPNGRPLGRVINPKAPEKQQWHENSKYHCSLIAYFMMAERFEDMRIYDSDVYFSNFSYRTELSKGLKGSKEAALHPQFGGTKIDIDKVRDVMMKRGCINFTISDGEIDNWQEVAKIVIESAEFNPCYHVQVGEHSKYSKHLLDNGIFVKLVKDEKDLYDFAIDLTDRIYGEKAEETHKKQSIFVS